MYQRVATDEYLYQVGYGRKTGRRHVVKLRFVKLDERTLCVLSLASGPAVPDWLRNLMSFNSLAKDALRTPSAHAPLVASKGILGVVNRVIVPVDPEEKQNLLEKFHAKYHGLFASLKHYYANSRPILIEFEPLPRDEDLIRELEFDFQASSYTSAILNNKISRWQREVTVSTLRSIFSSGQTVLEIGCGTGIETLELARSGVNVVALDISSTMLEHLDARAKVLGVSDALRTRKLASSEISLLKDDEYALPAGGFDGAFSHFGAMNLEPDLAKFPRNLSRILKPGAPVSFALWNRFCIGELPLKAIKFELGSSAQRMSGLVRAGERAKYSLDSRTYTPREFASHFSDAFDLVSYYALPALFVPPSEYATKLGGMLRFAKFDLRLGRLPFFRDLGDNFVMIMRRRS